MSGAGEFQELALLGDEDLDLQWRALQARLEELQDQKSKLEEPDKKKDPAAHKEYKTKWKEIDKAIEKVKKLKGRNATARCRKNSERAEKMRRLREGDDDD